MMKSYVCAALALSILAVTLKVFGVSTTRRSINDAATCIGVFTEDWGLGSSGQPKLILALWGDGYVVWSEDRLRGGSPYRSAKVAPETLARLLSELDRDGIFAEGALERNYFGPDSMFTTIEIRFKGKIRKLRSWHELAESKGTLVATANGVSALSNRSLFEALREQPKDYLLFRMVWNRVRSRTAELLPATGKAIQGRLVASHGSVSWEE